MAPPGEAAESGGEIGEPPSARTVVDLPRLLGPAADLPPRVAVVLCVVKVKHRVRKLFITTAILIVIPEHESHPHVTG